MLALISLIELQMSSFGGEIGVQGKKLVLVVSITIQKKMTYFKCVNKNYSIDKSCPWEILGGQRYSEG